MTTTKLMSIIFLVFLLSGCGEKDINLSTCQEKVKSFNMPNNLFEFILQDGDALESLKCFSLINKDITEAKEKAEQSLKNFKPDSEVIKATDEYKKLYSELEIKDNELKKLKEDLDKLKEKTKNPFDAFRKKE